MTAAAATRVRRAQLADLPQVAQLAAEHAAFEKAGALPPDLARRLETLLFDTETPRLRCFVAELNDSEIIGYASCAPEVSTWNGAEYLHMDCLFVREGHRGLRVGPLLVEAVVAEARALGLDHVQWQTPPWNTGALKFYERLGAKAKEKLRYHLPAN
ncbi:N-acetyltransferase family protein [Streptomyces sp. NPDC002787]